MKAALVSEAASVSASSLLLDELLLDELLLDELLLSLSPHAVASIPNAKSTANSANIRLRIVLPHFMFRLRTSASCHILR
jgi:hypothetical protein